MKQKVIQLFTVAYSLNNMSTLLTSFDVHSNPMSEPGEGLLCPFYSSEMTCPRIHILPEMELSLLHGLLSWSRLVPPLGTDGRCHDPNYPSLSSPHGSCCSSQNSGVTLVTFFSAKKLRPVEGSETASPQSYHEAPQSHDT